MGRIRKAVVCLALLVCAGCTDSGRQGLNPGDKAPTITGTDLAGAPKSLSDVSGKAILVNFWASWCGPCVTELPALQSLYDQTKDSGLQIVGVAVDDTVDNIKEKQKEFKLSYPIIVIDANSDVKKAFELKGLPESFVLDSQHRVLMVQDPGDGNPVSRLVGPREWSAPRSIEILRGLLK
jgi:thiol-disulfide isomerase/thioredoxin